MRQRSPMPEQTASTRINWGASARKSRHPTRKRFPGGAKNVEPKPWVGMESRAVRDEGARSEWRFVRFLFRPRGSATAVHETPEPGEERWAKRRQFAYPGNGKILWPS